MNIFFGNETSHFMNRKLLFVQGPEKTGTSTITGILNCHPEIFILFECYLGQPIITKYGSQLLDRYPEARRFFRSEDDYGLPVKEFFDFLSKREQKYSYKYVGTKLNSLDPGFTQRVRNHKIIFMKRDVKSWLLKESVIKRYRTDLDIVVPAMQYLEYIVKSYTLPHAYHLWMEDMIEKNDEVLSDLSGFLELNLDVHAQNWWEKFGKHEKSNPKNVFRLDRVHHSSRIKPERLDTKYHLIDHPFWYDVDEIFNKYYQYRTANPKYSKNQIEDDLTRIKGLIKYSPITLEESYSEALSIRLGFNEPREIHVISDKSTSGKKRSIFNKIRKRLKRIIDVALGINRIDRRMVLPLVFYDEFRTALEMIYILVNLDVFL